MSGFIFSKNAISDDFSVQTQKPSTSTSFSEWRHFASFDTVINLNVSNLLVMLSIIGNFTKNYNDSSNPTWGSGIEFYPMITDSRTPQFDGKIPDSIKTWTDGRTCNISAGFTQGSGFQLPPPQMMFMDVLNGLPTGVDLYVHLVARSYGYNTPIIGRTLFTMPV